jgi:hypothetical protein
MNSARVRKRQPLATCSSSSARPSPFRAQLVEQGRQEVDRELIGEHPPQVGERQRLPGGEQHRLERPLQPGRVRYRQS